MKRLPEILAAGATLTMPNGYRCILEDACVLPDGQLWFFGAYDREHFLEFDRSEDGDTWISLYDGLLLVAVIGPLEGADDENLRREWKAWLASDEGRVQKISIESMRLGAIDWHKN